MTRDWLSPLPLLIVRLASAMVPRRQRRDWFAEWSAELWQVCAEQKPAALAFSTGALQDGFWLGWNAMRNHGSRVLSPGSALRCELLLAATAMIGFLACGFVPGARNTMSPLPYSKAADLVLISSNGDPGTQSPSTRLADYREWTTNTGALYSQIAFYEPATGHVHLKHHRTADLALAVASENLLEMLQMRDGAGHGRVAAESSLPRLFLSRSAWARWYRSDPGVFGLKVQVRGQTAVVAGVIPDNDWRLPVHADAWLLEDAHHLDQLPPTLKGFVVARIRDSAFPPPRAGWRSMVETRNGVFSRYDCISLDSKVVEPILLFCCCMLLAALALPAVTALSLGDYPLSREPLRRRLTLRRWLFLGTKFVLVLALVYFWSTALAFAWGARDLSSAGGMQALLSFVPLLFGYRWILQDQRRRCPVCLRLLSNPARVGQPSCNFLGWCGTELICASGHGLLHIPEMPTSWFGTQRWLGLDPSWLCLFGEVPAGSPELV